MSSAALNCLTQRVDALERCPNVPQFVELAFEKAFAELQQLRERCARLEAAAAVAGCDTARGGQVPQGGE